MSRYDSEATQRFDQQFAESEDERNDVCDSCKWQFRAEKAEAERDALLAEITRIKAIPTLCDDCPAKMLRKQP